MEKKNKRQLLIWAIVVLVIINISSLSTIWFKRVQYNRTGRVEMRDQREHRRPAEMEERRRGEMREKFSQRFQKELDLSESQSNAVDSIHNLYFEQRRLLTQELAELKSKLDASLASTNLDEDSLNYLVEMQSASFTALNENAVQMNLAVRSVLNEDQIESFTATLNKTNKRRQRTRRPN